MPEWIEHRIAGLLTIADGITQAVTGRCPELALSFYDWNMERGRR